MSTYRHHHDIDLNDPVVSVRYLGDPIDDVIKMAEADNWVVRRYGDGHPIDPIVTLEAKPYDEISVRSRNGRVTAIGGSAWVTQWKDEQP